MYVVNRGASHLQAGARCSFALLCMALVFGCSAKPDDVSDAVRPVKTMVVVAGDDLRIRSFPGKVEASKRVEMAFQVSGLLVQLPVKEGQKIAQGELIASLRQDEFQARLQTLQAQLDQARTALTALRMGERAEERARREAQVRAAEARLVNARSTLARSTQLIQTRAISREALEADETNYRIAQEDFKSAVQLEEKGRIGRQEDIESQEASVRGLEARVVEAQLQLSDSTLRAPFDGVIARRFVELNQNIRAQDPIVQFQDVDEIDISVDVPETVMAADIRLSEIANLYAEFSGAPGLQFPVRIREIAQVADPTTQTFQVRVAMKASPDVRILPGMTSTVTLEYRRASVLGNRLLVPVSAVAKTPAGSQVAWVLGADGAIVSRPVKIGEASGGRIEVLSGLNPGDRIAVAGVPFLRDGMKVRDLGDALGGSR
jgi:multidrug efflux system membrane fusion protein